MRLTKIRQFLNENGLRHVYREEDNCGSVEFIYRGLRYHIWEFPAPERGADSNVRTAGRSEEFNKNYEDAILSILRTWEGLS